MEIDHINRDKLDNRKENLRTVTHLENCQNREPIKDGTVWKEKGRNVWRTEIVVNGKRKHLGVFQTKEEAQAAYWEKKQIAMLTTPCGSDTGRKTRYAQGGTALSAQIAMLPTPSASMMTMEDMEQARYAGNGGKRPKYADAMLPTPSSAGQSRDTRVHGNHSPSLGAAVGMLPTPKGRDWKGETQRGPDAPGDGIQNTLTAVSGITKQNRGQKTGTPLRLEPAFVEWMQGYPEGWTELTD